MDQTSHRPADGVQAIPDPLGATSSPAYYQGDSSSRDTLSKPPQTPSASSQLPPVVLSIFEDVKTRMNAVRGPDNLPWKEYRLEAGDFLILRKLLDEENDKVRYHYFSSTQTFAHEMPSLQHDYVSRNFGCRLRLKLLTMGSSEEEREFLRAVESIGFTDVSATTGPDFHQPDGFFSSRHSPSYGVALEIATSQKRQKLSELANFYLLESTGQTQMLIGIDYNYGRGMKRAALFTWRRDGSDSTAGSDVPAYAQGLRAKNGDPVSGPPLEIPFSCLAPQQHIPHSLRDKSIVFTAEELWEMMEEGDTIDCNLDGLKEVRRETNGSTG